MKLTAILLLSACLSASAKTGAQGITLSVKDISIEEAFKEIRKQSGMQVLYTKSMIKKAQKVTVHLKNASLEAAMSEILKNQNLSFNFINNTIVIKEKPSSTIVSQDADLLATGNEPPPIHVKGRIVNEKDQPVLASILVKGTSRGTTTNDNGEFELKGVEDNATLVISGVSIETFEVKVNGRSELAIVRAKTKIAVGEEVTVSVNTGYQSVSKERFVGSAAKLDSAMYNRRAGMNIIDRLDGTVSGVLFIRNNGTAPIQIRGISTLGQYAPGSGSAFSPLIVIDNFPFKGNLNSINPNDIEDITILRDAAATSIWGTLGGNGVIVITTKKGRYNQDVRVSLSSNTTIREKPDLYYLPQMSIEDFVGVEKFLFGKGFYNSSLSSTTSRPIISPVVEVLAKRRAGQISASDSAAQIAAIMSHDLRDDLDKYVYQNAIYQQHYINASGGGNNMNFSLGIGFNNLKPEVKGVNGDNQFTLNSTLNYRPFKNLEIQTGINLTKNTTQAVSLSSNSVGYPSKVSPYARLADDAGNALAIANDIRLAYVDTAGGGKLLDWHYRPLDEIKTADNVFKSYLARINFGLSYRITNWLKADVKYQYLQETGNTRLYFSPESYVARNLINRFTQIAGSTITRKIPLGGIVDLTNTSGTSNNIRGQLNVNRSWNTAHDLTGVVAAEVSETKSSSNISRYYGYDDNLATFVTGLDYTTSFPIYGKLSSNQRIDQRSTINEGPTNRYVSLLVNASYTYLKKYTVYASARRDGANVFGVKTNNKWKPLWSAGASWEISKEKFYHLDWAPQLRLRASYGYSGNVDNNRSGFSNIRYSNPAIYTLYPSAVVGSSPNPDLRWEQVGIFNTGIDFSVLKNRISGSFEWFQKNSRDIIALTPVDPTTGVSNFTVNVASLKANGYDLRLNSINLTGPVRWETSFGLSYVKVIVTRYDNGGFKASQFINYGINPIEGQIAWGISSYKFAGLDPLTGDPQGIFNKTVSKDYLKILDDSLNNQVFHGSLVPLYTGNFFNSFTWKGFTLSANITYRLQYYFRKTTINYENLFTSWSGHADFAKRWQKPGDELITTVPSMPYPNNVNRDVFYINSEVNVKRGDNVRLQDIRLGYNLTTKGQKNSPFKSAQVFLYANNLNIMLWRKDKEALDPDYGTITPPSRSLTAGFNINF